MEARFCLPLCPVCRDLNGETGLAEGKYEVDCWYCGACELDCPTQAITVDLPYLVS